MADVPNVTERFRCGYYRANHKLVRQRSNAKSEPVMTLIGKYVCTPIRIEYPCNIDFIENREKLKLGPKYLIAKIKHEFGARSYLIIFE